MFGCNFIEMEEQVENMIAQRFLGYSQGATIIAWAVEQLRDKSVADDEFLSDLAALDPRNNWEKARAEKLFFEKFHVNNDEMQELVKRFFVRYLENVLNGKKRMWNMCEYVALIKEKFPQAKWMGELFGYCSYILPDATNTSQPIRTEIEKVLNDLKKNN